MKKCAVCGDTCELNVRLKWLRKSDHLVFDVCLACAEISGKVNAEAVNNFGGGVPATPEQVQSAFSPRPARTRVVSGTITGKSIR